MTSSYTDSFDYLNSDLSSRYFVDSLAPTRSSLASLDADLTTNADSLPTGAFLEFSRVLKSRHIPGPVVLFTSNPEHLLGSGAQFSVYTGTLFIYPEASQRTDSFPNELVAVKIPHFHIDAGEHLSLASPKFQRQLHDMLLEILVHGHPALSRHRNIARLVAWGKDMRGYHNMPCLAFELALGDLGRTLRGMKELAFETRLGLSCDVGAGLDAIHEFGIIHGDLKPANILVFPSGTGFVAKLADFGLSMDEAKEEYTKPPGGTPGWQAPEVGRYFEDGGLVLTSELPGTDTYSFGLLVWSVMLLNGDPPQNGVGDRTAVAVSKAFSRLRESVGQSKVDMLEKAVQSFLSPLAKDRPKSIGNLLGGEPIPPPAGPEADKNYQPKIGVNRQMFDWELPEISTDNLLELVQSSEAENADLPNQLLFGIFLMATSYWEHRGLGRLGYLTPEFILKRLGTLAYRNYEPAQALVLRVYQFLETPLPGSIEGLLVFWLSNGVKTGSWVAGTDLKSLDEPEYKLAAGEFRNTGGYNTLLSPMTLLDNSVIGSDDPSIIISDRYDTLLHYASAFSGQTDLFERLLLHKSLPASINARNKVGETPLHRACMAGLSSRVLALLKNGADPKLLTGFPRISCLHWIFCFPLENMEEAARALVAGGANVHSTTLSSLPWLHFPFSFVRGSPLHWAVAASSPVAITTLLKLGADPELGNLADPYRYAGHVRILEMVSGANHTMYSRPSGPTRGLTALDMAAELTDHVALQCVIDHARPLSHTVDEEGYNPFHRLDSAHTARTSSDIPFTTQFFHGGSAAARFSALTKTVQALATLGFNINQVTTPQQTLHAQVGRTPLMLSIELGSLPTATALASHPSTNLETPNLTGETALMVIPMPNNLDLDFLHLLLDLGANPLAANSLGHNTVLRRCARMAITPRDLTAIDLLLNLGVDFSARFTDKSRSGYQRRRSAAALALRSHRAVPEMLQVLQKHVFASPRKTSLMENADAWGGSLLHYAAEAGYAEPVRALVENGARVNAEREVLVFRSGNEDGAVGGEGMEMETALDVARAGRRGKEIVSNYRSRRETQVMLDGFDEVIGILERAGGRGWSRVYGGDVDDWDYVMKGG